MLFSFKTSNIIEHWRNLMDIIDLRNLYRNHEFFDETNKKDLGRFKVIVDFSLGNTKVAFTMRKDA